MIDKAKALAVVKKLTEETDEEFITIMIEKSEEFILNYCNQIEVPLELQGALEDFTILRLNLLGKDGLNTESLGSYSSSFTHELPPNIKSQLNRHRLMRFW